MAKWALHMCQLGKPLMPAGAGAFCRAMTGTLPASGASMDFAAVHAFQHGIHMILCSSKGSPSLAMVGRSRAPVVPLHRQHGGGPGQACRMLMPTAPCVHGHLRHRAMADMDGVSVRTATRCGRCCSGPCMRPLTQPGNGGRQTPVFTVVTICCLPFLSASRLAQLPAWHKYRSIHPLRVAGAAPQPD
jgi:hypothetical protein